jgi:hypothetical protein
MRDRRGGQSVNTWDDLEQAMVLHYGQVEEDFTMRAKLRNLVVRNDNIVQYTKLFNTTAQRIMVNQPNDQQLISDFLANIKNTKFYEPLVTNPATARLWDSWLDLYNYVLSKYTLLQQMGSRDGRPKDGKGKRPHQPSSNPDMPPGIGDAPFQKRHKQHHNNGGQNGARGNGGNQSQHGGNPSNGGKHQPQWDKNTLDIKKLVPGQKLSKKQRDHLATRNPPLCFKCFRPGHVSKECKVPVGGKGK